MEIYRSKLYKISDDFVKELEALEAGIIARDRQKEKEISELKELQKRLKEQQFVNDKALESKQDKLNIEIQKQKTAVANLNEDNLKTNKLNSELGAKIRKAEENLKISAIERKLSSDELAKHQKKTKEYQAKIDSLQADFERLDKKKEDITERERKAQAKEAKALKRDAESIERERVLGERELDIRIKEKKIILEYKRLKLNE